MSHMFSIITSAYNAQAFMVRTLEAVKQQTEKDYEYIIIDNGSDDSTYEIIQEFIEENPQMEIKLYHLEKNQGISGGRNAGIEHASGEYICFLDADDCWYENKLKEVKKAIEDNSECTVFCHWEDHIKDKGTPILKKYRQINNACPYEDLLFNGNCLSTSAMTIRKSSIREIGGFDRSLQSGEEDYDCWLRLARNGAKFFMIEKALGVWTIRSDSISAKHINHTEAVTKVINAHFEYLYKQLPNKRKIKKRQKKAVARNYCGCARTLSLEKKRKYATDMYIKSLRCDCTYWKSYVGLILNMLHI